MFLIPNVDEQQVACAWQERVATRVARGRHRDSGGHFAPTTTASRRPCHFSSWEWRSIHGDGNQLNTMLQIFDSIQWLSHADLPRANRQCTSMPFTKAQWRLCQLTSSLGGQRGWRRVVCFGLAVPCTLPVAWTEELPLARMCTRDHVFRAHRWRE